MRKIVEDYELQAKWLEYCDAQVEASLTPSNYKTWLEHEMTKGENE